VALLSGILAVAALAESADFTKPKVKGRLLGKLRAMTYVAPKEIFSVPSPVDGDWGGLVEDKAGYVGFSDDAGQVFRIEYIDYTADFDALRTQLGSQKFFERMLSELYLPRTILAASPDARFVAQTFSDAGDPMLVTCWFVPKGSNMMKYSNGVSERLDTYRSVAVLVRKTRMYFISLAPSNGKVVRFGNDPEKELWPVLKEATIKFIGSIDFKTP